MKRVIVAFGILFTLLMAGNHALAATLEFVPGETSIAGGETLDVDINISGLSLIDLAAFDFNLQYDDSVLAFAGYTLGDQLGAVVSTDILDFTADAYDGSADLGGGVINLMESSWLMDLSFQTDAFTLATLSFTGQAQGSSALQLSNIILSDAFGDPIGLDFIGEAKVNVVPEPATMVLFGIGLVTLAGLRRRMK